MNPDEIIDESLAERRRRIEGILPRLLQASDKDLLAVERTLGLVPSEKPRPLPWFVRWQTWLVILAIFNAFLLWLAQSSPARFVGMPIFFLPVSVITVFLFYKIEQGQRVRGLVL